MVFEPKIAQIFKVVKQEKFFFRFTKPLKILFFCAFVFLFLGWLFLDFDILGCALISLSLSIFFRLQETFFNSKLKKPGVERDNLASYLSFEVARAVLKAEKLAKLNKLGEVNSTLVFYALLEDEKEVPFIFSRAVLNLEEIKRRLKEKINPPPKKWWGAKEGEFKGFSEDFIEALTEAFNISRKKGHERIKIGNVIVALAKREACFEKILIDFNLGVEDFENIVFWLEFLEKRAEERKRFWSKENLAPLGSLGKEWVAGYTVTLDRFSVDLTKTFKGIIELIGHKQDLEKLERALAGGEINNVLLVGEPGTGRKTILQYFAQKSLFGQLLPEINYKRVVFLDIPSLISQVGPDFKVEGFLERVFSEVVKAGNVILVIDEFQNYVGGLRRPGIIDISGILLKYLRHPEFRLIGLTTSQGLHRYIEPNPGLEALFERVEVTEISPQETTLLLEILAGSLERKYKRFISYLAIRDIVNFTDRYLPSFAFPKKAIDLLDEAMVYLSTSTKDKVLLPRHIAKVVTEKTKIPVGEMEWKEREILLNLEELIHKRIINQDEAVEEVAEALRRARAEVTIRKRPVGVFLFLGPTGVGKTETAKALAETYFGLEENMLRLDMSEFQAIEDIPRLIGSVGQEGLLTTPVRERPFSLILLDEIEKAHPNVLNLFLQVFDEGHITDGLGRKVSFKNSIIIATSNAGAEIIWEDIRQDKKLDIVKEDLLSYLFEKATFHPEFINRFDTVAIFKPLTRENLLNIAELKLEDIKQGLEQKHIEFEITWPLKQKIVELSYSPEFGARAMNRVIQDRVEDPLAEALLRGEIKRGDRIQMTEDFKIVKQ